MQFYQVFQNGDGDIGAVPIESPHIKVGSIVDGFVSEVVKTSLVEAVSKNEAVYRFIQHSKPIEIFNPTKIVCTAKFNGSDLVFQETIEHSGSCEFVESHMIEILDKWYDDRFSYNWRHHPSIPNLVQACFKLEGWELTPRFNFDSNDVSDPDLHVRQRIASRLELSGVIESNTIGGMSGTILETN